VSVATGDVAGESRLGAVTRTAVAIFGVARALVVPAGEAPDGALVVPDLAADERFRDSRWTSEGYRFLAARPLCAGSLCLLGMEPRAWSEEDEQRLADLARWADSELRRADDEALRQRDEVVLAAADAAVFGVDARGRVTFANPAAGVLLGAPVERIVGTDFHATFHHTRLDGTPYPWTECPSNAALRTGVRQRLRRDAVHRLDGTRVEVEYSGTPLVVGGEVVGVVVTLSDLTEQRAVERVKDEFVSIVSHELRTPLTSIRGSLGLLGSGRFGDLPPKAARLVEIAMGNSDRLIRLVNDMLDLERLDAGEVALDRIVQPLRRLYDRVEDDVSAAAAEARVAIAFRGGDVPVDADAALLARALSNLVANAVKFSPPGGAVDVAAVRDGDEMRITVTDRGRGIEPERLERIFDRFAQGDSSDTREKGGAGLGLAIARSVVEHHGGRLTAVSEPGETTFEM
jgi:PAS domain S-box-containing protein